MLDVDGVVYRGPVAVPDVAERLAAVRTEKLGTVFLANNAARGVGLLGRDSSARRVTGIAHPPEASGRSI